MNYKDNIIRRISDAACGEVSAKVVRSLRKMTEGMQSGDDTPLKNIWDEVCVQRQDGQSDMWDAYEDTILSLTENELGKLDDVIIGSIWLQTKEGQDWDGDNQDAEEENVVRQNDSNEFYFVQIESEAHHVENKIPDTVEYNLDDVARYIVEEYVLKTASGWKNR
jgi:hypothetical protein